MIQQYYVMPSTVYGQPNFPLKWSELNWLNDLPKDTYFALWVNLPSITPKPFQLPLGHSLYVITFHQEGFDFEWVMSQVSRIDAPIIILSDGSVYNIPLPSNVYFYNYHSWHYHTSQIMTWFPNRQPRNVKYKVSNICNRITQSKLIAFTALMEYLPQEDLLVKLGDWLEEKNVHNWQPTGNKELDRLTDVFKNKYHGQTISIDKFDNSKDNFQSITSNPWQPVLLESALHFVSESFHYSLMHNDYGQVILPGPIFSEKTFKCLVSGTPFIFVGQFEAYKFLCDLGMKFDYGGIDLSWDNDPGNLTRLAKIVNMIKTLANYTTADIIDMTKDSTEYNTDYIWSGDFNTTCQGKNEVTANQILAKFK